MSEYRINDTTKWGMLILALMFDGVQFITPGIMDTFITATAALVFAMLLAEKHALTISSGRALRYARILAMIGEVFIGNLPLITLTVMIQIYISRAVDNMPSDTVAKILSRGKLVSNWKNEQTKQRTIIKHQKTQIKKYAYGKGRRGAQTLKRKIGIKNSTKTSRVQRKLDTQKVV